jgi:hypothetical protein
MMPAGADMPSRFDYAMLHKRDVDVIEGVPPSIGTSMTTIALTHRHVTPWAGTTI